MQKCTLDCNSAKTGSGLYLSKVNKLTLETTNFSSWVSNISNGGAIAIMQDMDSVVSIKKTLL